MGIFLTLVTGYLAYRKGYSFWLWMFSNLVGLMWLAFLPYANKVEAPEEAERLRKRGNQIGGVLSVVVLILFFGLLSFLRTHAQSQ